jgi:hypothetical protein
VKQWLICGLVGVCAGTGAYLIAYKKEMPPPSQNVLEPPATPALASGPPTLPTSVVLAKVVEMTDLDPLLDPPAKQCTGEPFDGNTTSTAATAVATNSAPDRIPLAANDPSSDSELSIFGYLLGRVAQRK